MPSPSNTKFGYLPVALPPNSDFKKQCVEVPGTKRPGQTGASTSRSRRLRAKLTATNAQQLITADVSVITQVLCLRGGWRRAATRDAMHCRG